MSFAFPVDPAELIAERAPQWLVLGLAPDILTQMSRRIRDLWAEGPGGWAYEWSVLAERAEKDGDLLMAARLYGFAKFPVLGNPAHARAYDNQIRTYLQASTGFEVPFRRRLAEISYRGEVVQVPTHLYLPEQLPEDAPVVLVLSGVDTWKCELHNSALITARALGARIATIDMPGTGESSVPNSPDGEQYVAGVIDWLRRQFPRSRKVGAIGFSFGGHWTIKLALMGAVDAAVSVGGLVESVFTPAGLDRLRFGMPGIFGNSLRRWDSEPSQDQLTAAMAPFSLRTQGMLEDWGTAPVPLLFYNGTEDPHVPVDDAKALQSRPNTVVRLVPGATHCAMEQARELIPWSLDWLAGQLV